MTQPQTDTTLVDLDKVMPILKISKATALRLANGEWGRFGVAIKVGGQWRVNWPKFLSYYNLQD